MIIKQIEKKITLILNYLYLINNIDLFLVYISKS